MPVQNDLRTTLDLVSQLSASSSQAAVLKRLEDSLAGQPQALRRDLAAAIQQALVLTRLEPGPARVRLAGWGKHIERTARPQYDSHLYAEGPGSALQVPEIKPVYSPGSPSLMGFEILNACFDAALGREPRLVAFGEDVGRLGDVNQGFRGLQEKYGPLRVADTGIREATILGQAIGLALRGLRPLAEIQYLDYLLYALQIMSDDLASLHWRTRGGQTAPVIIRTRGHRLEGIWHSGSPMAGILNWARGMYIVTPRNMTQAAGFYNTLLRAEEPALVVEVLNGYRIKERLPDNLAEFSVPLGAPEVLRSGADLTLVTYGACCRLALEAAERLSQVGIDCEVIDVQTLLPFDRSGLVGQSLQKTSRVLFVDEDVPGGTTAYMLQEVLEKQGGYAWLDAPPRTLTARAHRPAYGSDGDYWSKPNVEQIFMAAYNLLREAQPGRYPEIEPTE